MNGLLDIVLQRLRLRGRSRKNDRLCGPPRKAARICSMGKTFLHVAIGHDNGRNGETMINKTQSWLFGAGLAALLSGGALAQTGTNMDWPTYGADLAGSHYLPLDQINGTNFSKLEMVWRFKTDNIGNRPEYKLEGTPLEVGGVVYTTAGSRRGVVALDAVTGELLWVHGEHEGARGAAAPRQLSGRGLSYWTDGKDARILYVTPGYRLICLDAKNGQLVTSFGKNGVVDLKLDDDQTIL